VELLAGPRASQTFDLAREPASIRQRYGDHLWCQQALLARRLVEAGVPRGPGTITGTTSRPTAGSARGSSPCCRCSTTW
jgi:hypothetical protein